MATINLDNVQFWDPLSNPFLHKQRTASSHSMSKATYTTSSRNRPALLHNKAARIFQRNDQSTSAIAATQRQRDDSAARAQGRNNDLTNRDDETDDDFPSIEELLSQISRKGISTGGCRNPEDTLQYLEEPTLDTSGSRPSPTQSRLDDGVYGSQGTRDKPVILEDGESDTPNPEATAEPSKPTDPFSHGPWCDVEDRGYVDDDLRPVPPLEQGGLASTPPLAHGQPYSHDHPPGSSQDQNNRRGDDGTMGGALDEPTPHSLLTPLDESDGGGSDENVSELDTDLLLAFEEQERSSSAAAPSSPHPHRPSAEPPHPQIDQEHNQSGSGYVRLEELRHGSPLRSQDQEGEEPQEQQRQQGVAVKAMREEGEDGGGGDDEERESRGKKRRHQDEAKEIGSGIHQPESSEHSHNTNDEDDGDPRPAKRQKLPSAPALKAATPPREHSSTPRITPPSTTKPEMDETRPQAEHGHQPSPVDDEHRHTPRTSRSPSAAVESVAMAEYQEWLFQGFLKRTKIGNETTYNLEFKLPRISEHLNLPIDPEALDMSTNSERSAEAGIPHDAVAHSKMHPVAVRPQIKRVRWAPEEDATILKMREEDGCSWEEIHAALPHRSIGTIQNKMGSVVCKKATLSACCDSASPPPTVSPLGSPSTTRPEIDEAQPQDDHGCSSTFVDDEQHRASWTSLSPPTANDVVFANAS